MLELSDYHERLNVYSVTVSISKYYLRPCFILVYGYHGKFYRNVTYIINTDMKLEKNY